MKSVSFLALAAAMALSVSAPAFAQDVNGTVDAATDAGVSGGVGDTTVDANVDVDASATVEGDVDGDGVLSEEERSAAASTSSTTTDDESEGVCPAPEYSGSDEISDEDLAVLSAAATAQFILVEDCETGGSLVSDGSVNTGAIDTAIFANQSIAAELSARGVGDIIGVSIEGDAVTIYAEENEGNDDTDASTTTTTTTDGATTSGEAGAEVEAGVEATVQ